MAQLRLKSEERLTELGKRVRKAIKSLPKFGDSPRAIINLHEISSLSQISVDNIKTGIKELEREGYIARMFKGRASKANVYALLNPDLKGDVWRVWG